MCGSGVQEDEETEPEYRCDHNMNRDRKWKLHGWCVHAETTVRKGKTLESSNFYGESRGRKGLLKESSCEKA